MSKIMRGLLFHSAGSRWGVVLVCCFCKFLQFGGRLSGIDQIIGQSDAVSYGTVIDSEIEAQSRVEDDDIAFSVR